MKLIYLLGNGGLAREIRYMAKNLGHYVQLLDKDQEYLVDGRNPILIAVGIPSLRADIADRFRNIARETLIDDLASVDAARIGDGTVICAGARITCDVRMGRDVLINLNATVGHDVSIGDCAVINPGAHLSGGCSIGRAALIGCCASVLEGVHIGDYARVGAGAVVTRDVEPGQTVIGVPAGPVVRVVN